MTKQTLILLPGLLCDKTVWEHQLNGLDDIADMIIPDLSGASTPDQMIDAVIAVAPPSFALAGHSMGGWVALEVAHRYASRVTKLCLINTSAKEDNEQKASSRKQLIKLANQGEYPFLIDQLLKRFVYQTSFEPQIRRMLVQNQMALISQQSAMLMRQSCVGFLPAIDCPTLIIHAEHDAVFSLDDAKQLEAGIVNAKLVIVQNCGHMSTIEAAAEVTDLMRAWLLVRNPV